jgi:hypothetical protein
MAAVRICEVGGTLMPRYIGTLDLVMYLRQTCKCIKALSFVERKLNWRPCRICV